LFAGFEKFSFDSLIGHESRPVPDPWRYAVLPALVDNAARSVVVVPIWMLFVASAIASTLFHRRARRERLIGCCPNCEYNLTGNTTGVCPECGAPTPTKE